MKQRRKKVAKTEKLVKPKKPARKPATIGKLVTVAGGGQLWRGAATNHVPGTGRPPSAIRELMRQHLDLEVLAGVMADYRKGDLSKLDVANFLAKYGLGEKNEVTLISPEILSRLQAQVALISSRPTWEPEQLITALAEVWK